jgi:acyl-ACP thioesterase
MGLYLTFRQMDLKRLPAYGETVMVKSWVYDCDRLFGWRNSVIYDSKGEICVASVGMGAFVDLAKGLPARLPPELLNSIIRSDPLDMEALPRKIPVPPDMAAAGEALRVQAYHLDNYDHMNNARYLDLASGCLPEGFSPRRLRIEYKRPAQQGDLIQPYRGMRDQALVVTLNAPDGAVFAAVEFQG